VGIIRLRRGHPALIQASSEIHPRSSRRPPAWSNGSAARSEGDESTCASTVLEPASWRSCWISRRDSKAVMREDREESRPVKLDYGAGPSSTMSGPRRRTLRDLQGLGASGVSTISDTELFIAELRNGCMADT